MHYCIHNEIITPDGTSLVCKHRHDYKAYTDKVSGEWYMIDGLGYYTRSSVNKVKPIDKSIWIDLDNIRLTEEIRNVKFWGTRGKYGAEELKYISLAELDDEYLDALIEYTVMKNPNHNLLFKAEKKYRETI